MLLRPVLKVKYINNCEAILYFKDMGLFLICQGGWDLGGQSNMIRLEMIYWFSIPGQCFVGFSFFVEMTFHTKKLTAQQLFATEIDNPSPSTP